LVGAVVYPGNAGNVGGVADPGVPPGGVVQPDSRAALSESSSTDRRQALRIRKVIDSM
jgi:hypothetical protein